VTKSAEVTFFSGSGIVRVRAVTRALSVERRTRVTDRRDAHLNILSLICVIDSRFVYTSNLFLISSYQVIKRPGNTVTDEWIVKLQMAETANSEK
jgi:hypothetical protein